MTDYERWSELADRDAIGELLSEDERAFLESFAEGDPLARAELAVLGELGGFASLDVADDAEDFAARAVDRFVAERRAPVRSLRRSLSFAGGALAVAAAVAVWMTAHRAPSASSATIEYASGSVFVDGVAAAKGGAVVQGSVVRASGGPVCIALEPTLHTCIPADAEIRLTALGGLDRRMDLVRGRVAAALFPLPAGQHFSIVANGISSTAVGTAFTVELGADGSVRTVVHEGRVRVDGNGQEGLVAAHAVGTAQGRSIGVAPLVAHGPTETPDWEILGTLAGRPTEAPFSPPAVAETSPPAALLEVPAPANVEEPKVRSVASGHRAAEAKPDVASTSDLLATARQALREQRWSDAAAAYKALVTAYPSSPEAHMALVPLGNLEVDQLGAPAQGLADLNAYLAMGGPLDVEARLGQIRAYKALGDNGKEASAIDEFLSVHPNDLRANALRARRASLTPGSAP